MKNRREKRIRRQAWTWRAGNRNMVRRFMGHLPRNGLDGLGKYRAIQHCAKTLVVQLHHP